MHFQLLDLTFPGVSRYCPINWYATDELPSKYKKQLEDHLEKHNAPEKSSV